jgi:hypothetical protein
MKYSADPKQNWLFDPVLETFSPVARKRLTEGWPGLFRTCLLELMPVDEVGTCFDDSMGRPTKELYSACGLMLLMEFNNWTVEQAADAYMFDARVQFALNLGRDRQSMCTRTIERYQVVFRDKELGKVVNDRITRHLVDLLELEVDKLRLDSTHIFSNMASFGRTRLMLTVTRRFLIQLKRHEAELYAELSEELRDRYSQKKWEFGKGKSDTPKREEIAEDMHLLIARFESNERVFNRTSFQDLFRVFTEQCDVVEGKISLRKKTGGNTMQNPSDPDATYDGKKGSGYQVQVAETCSEENDTQLIVGAIPQTANEHDQKAVEQILNDLESNDIAASTIVADAGYGGDPSFCTCQEKGINLVAPVIRGGMDEDRIQLSEFCVEDSCLTACPMGHSPLKTWFDEEKDRGSAVFAAEHCENCECLERCRAVATTKNYCVQFDGRALRNSLRRERISSSSEAELYAKRSGVEATFSEGKRSTGMDRLRVRGQRSVYHAILGRITGINIKRAARSEKIQETVKKKLKVGTISALSRVCRDWILRSGACINLFRQFPPPEVRFQLAQRAC